MRKTYKTPQGGPTEIAAEMPDCAGRNGAHTAGPWSALPLNDEDDFDVMTASVLVHNRRGTFTAQALGRTSKEVVANAHLIAAAPELLDACRQALGCDLDPATNALIRAAITKAEGRS